MFKSILLALSTVNKTDQSQSRLELQSIVCPAWVEFKKGLDLGDIKDLVTFFRRLLEEREKVEDGKA